MLLLIVVLLVVQAFVRGGGQVEVRILLLAEEDAIVILINGPSLTCVTLLDLSHSRSVKILIQIVLATNRLCILTYFGILQNLLLILLVTKRTGAVLSLQVNLLRLQTVLEQGIVYLLLRRHDRLRWMN